MTQGSKPASRDRISTLNQGIIMSKPPFDLIILTIHGNKFIVPRDAGMAVFSMFANNDTYKMDYQWSGGHSANYATLVEDGAVKLESIGPVEFMKLRAEAEAKAQRDAAKGNK
jgi:hypothetical protein